MSEVERLRKNLADFREKHFHKSKYLYLDVTCKRSIKTILVQILENVSLEIRQVFPQPLYRRVMDGSFCGSEAGSYLRLIDFWITQL
jgi:hypothetical protein